MKLVWHLFRKDLARVKFFAATLLLLAALRPLLGIIALVQDDFTYREASRHEILDVSLLIFHVIGIWLLTLWLAQLDSPRRPDAFLHTRPVSRSALWMAKLFGAWILCALAPLFVWLPWWLGCGMAGADLRALAITYVGGMALLTIPALTLGALVSDYRRAVLWSVALAVVVMCLPVLLTNPGESRWRFLANRDGALRLGAWLLIGLSAVFALLGLLYRRHPRWTGFAVWAATAATLSGAFSRTYWPAAAAPVDPLKGNSVLYAEPPAGSSPPWREHNAVAFPNLRIDLISLKRRLTETVYEQGPRKEPVYTLRIHATGTDGLVPQIGIEAITFSARDGTSVRRRDDRLFLADFDDVSALFTEPASGAAPKTRPAAINFTSVWNDDSLDMLSGPLAVHANLRVTLRRPVLVSRHPLERTGWHRAGGIGYRIRSVRETTEGDRGVELNVVKTTYRSSGLWNLWRWLEQYDPPLSKYIVVFDSQGHRVWERLLRSSPTYTVAGVQVKHDTCLLQQDPIQIPNGAWQHPTPSPEWLAGLSYAAGRLETVARGRRELVATDLRLERED